MLPYLSCQVLFDVYCIFYTCFRGKVSNFQLNFLLQVYNIKWNIATLAFYYDTLGFCTLSKNTSKRFNPKVCIIITSLKYAKSLLIVMKNESTFLCWSKYLNIFSCPALLWHMHTEAVLQFLSKNSIFLKTIFLKAFFRVTQFLQGWVDFYRYRLLGQKLDF